MYTSFSLVISQPPFPLASLCFLSVYHQWFVRMPSFIFEADPQSLARFTDLRGNPIEHGYYLPRHFFYIRSCYFCPRNTEGSHAEKRRQLRCRPLRTYLP